MIIALSPCRYCNGTRVRNTEAGRFWYCPDCNSFYGRAWKNDPYGVFFPPGGYSSHLGAKVIRTLNRVYRDHYYQRLS